MQLTFQDYVTHCEEKDFNEATRLLAFDTLTENVFSTLSKSVQSKITFVKDLAKHSKTKVQDLAKMLQNKKAFEFFVKIKFSMQKLFKLVKTGYKMFSVLESVIAEYVAQTKIVKFTQKHLKSLDEFLKQHPKTKKLAGVAVGGLLVYIWLNMSFTPDLEYSMDFTDILNALAGTFSLEQIFSGPEGVKLITYFITGALGLSFPWPGATSVQFTLGVITSLGKIIHEKIKS